MRAQGVKPVPCGRGRCPGSAAACHACIPRRTCRLPGQTTSGTAILTAAERCAPKDILAVSSFIMELSTLAYSARSGEAIQEAVEMSNRQGTGSTSVAGAELDAAPHRKGGFS